MSKICVKCSIEMRCKKTGQPVALMKSDGTVDRLHSADLFACPECGAEFIPAMAIEPYAFGEKAEVFVKAMEAIHQRVIRCWANQREKELATMVAKEG